MDRLCPLSLEEIEDIEIGKLADSLPDSFADSSASKGSSGGSGVRGEAGGDNDGDEDEGLTPVEVHTVTEFVPKHPGVRHMQPDEVHISRPTSAADKDADEI